MPKHRKTKKQKVQAIMRQHTVSSTVFPVSPNSSVSLQSTRIPEKFSLQGSVISPSGLLMMAHAYLPKELLKTAALSVVIILCELLLFFLLRNHTVVLFHLSY